MIESTTSCGRALGFPLSHNGGLPILYWNLKFLGKTEGYIWHSCMDLVDVLC